MMMSKSILKPLMSLGMLAATLTPTSAWAAMHVSPAVHSFLGASSNPKMISFKLKNKSGAPIELRVGEQIMTLAPDQVMDFKLASGTRIVTTAKTEKREAGSVICEVSPQLSSSTLTLN